MDLSFMEEKQEELDQKMTLIASSFDEDAIQDGIISPNSYIESPFKMLWLAREPHDTDGGYDYKREILKGLNNGIYKKDKYFDQMRYALYSLENNFLHWEDIPDSDTSEYIANKLREVAFVNCSKIPGGANLNWERWWKYVKAFKEIVFEQIELARPDIIVCVGTQIYLKEFGYLENATEHEKSYRHYYLKGSQIILDCYHIAARFSPEKYLDDIVDAIRQAKIHSN